MIWINIRTVAAEIYLTVSDIPQMSGSVFFPHRLETVFWKNLPDRQAVNAPPAGFIWQQICYSIRCCRRQLSFVKSIPAGYTIYRCVIDTMHTFIRFSIYKIIFVRFMEVLTFSFSTPENRNLPARFSHTRFLHYSDTHRYRKNQPRHLPRCTTRNHCTPPADDMPRSPCRP